MRNLSHQQLHHLICHLLHIHIWVHFIVHSTAILAIQNFWQCQSPWLLNSISHLIKYSKLKWTPECNRSATCGMSKELDAWQLLYSTQQATSVRSNRLTHLWRKYALPLINGMLKNHYSCGACTWNWCQEMYCEMRMSHIHHRVEDCGLVIHEQLPFLAASTHGVSEWVVS